MIACVCRLIPDREIARYARAGMRFDEAPFDVGAAAQPGCRESRARDVPAPRSATRPVAAWHNDALAQPVPHANSNQERKA